MLAARKVLVVEDEYFIAQDLQNALKREGATVVGPVSEPDLALKLVADGIDLAVLDINLLGAVDFTIADQLAARGIPFVFATGYESATIPERHRGAPVWQKPYRTEELVASLSSILP